MTSSGGRATASLSPLHLINFIWFTSYHLIVKSGLPILTDWHNSRYDPRCEYTHYSFQTHLGVNCQLKTNMITWSQSSLDFCTSPRPGRSGIHPSLRISFDLSGVVHHSRIPDNQSEISIRLRCNVDQTAILQCSLRKQSARSNRPLQRMFFLRNVLRGRTI